MMRAPMGMIELAPASVLLPGFVHDAGLVDDVGMSAAVLLPASGSVARFCFRTVSA